MAKPSHEEGEDLDVLVEQINAWNAGAAIPGELPDPPNEDPDRITLREAARAKQLIEELARRRAESLSIFEPLPVQEEFFASTANERLFLGGNRGGKTITGAVEAARILCGKDPFKKQPEKDGRMHIVGKDLNHCGKVMARKLFRAGAFFMIKDPTTKLWRSYRPHDQWDHDNRHLRRPAPPLIPPRLVKYISWENKKEGIVKSFGLKNGWEATFYSSEGDPPQGVDVNAIWFDEEIIGANWYLESAMRLVDRNGIFWWTATPQAGTIELYDLYERALEAMEPDSDSVTRDSISVYQISMMDNPYLDEEARQKVLKKIKDEGDYEVRVDGRFALHGLRVYPEFQPTGVHHVDTFLVPPSWTRYVVVDPGVQVCGVLFGAVPPPNTKGFANGQIVIYDELYLRRCEAGMFGKAMARRCQGVEIYCWAIDYRMGRQTLVTGKTTAQHYAEACKAQGLTSVRSGNNFLWASDDVKGGIESVRQLLRVQDNGLPRLLVMSAKCPNLVKEGARYSYIKKPSGEVTDDPIKRKFHLMDCLRYFAKLEPKYHKSKPGDVVPRGYAVAILEKKRERARVKHEEYEGSYTRLG